MKTTTLRIAILVFTLASLAVFARKPTTRTIAGPKLTKPASSAEAAQARLAENYGKVPLSFEVNRGQTDPRVKFLSRGSGYTLFLAGDEAVLSLRSQKSGVRSQKSEGRPWSLVAGHLQKTGAQGTKDKGPGTTDVLRMKLVGANQAAKVTALEELPGKSNYFIGSDPKKWRTDVPTYGKVKYAGVYPGVDLVYYGNQRQLEYDFVVAPGADPKAITLAVEAGLPRHDLAGQAGLSRHNRRGGVKPPLRIDANGNLVVEAEGGEVRFHKPVFYQPTADAANPKSKIQNRKLIDGRYILTTNNHIGFEISSYDKSRPLVIDPTLVYSTYFGDSWVSPNAIAVDAQGNACITGVVGTLNPTNFPTTPGAFQTSSRSEDTVIAGDQAFVTKFDPTGTSLVYSTYLGGVDEAGATSLALDSSGNAYVTGWTNSSNFPTANAYQSSNPSGNYQVTFVAKLNATGNGLIFSTYFGGHTNIGGPPPAPEGGNAIAVDASGNAYVAGDTQASDFPTTSNAFQRTYGGGTCPYYAGDGTMPCPHGFVAKFGPVGALLYSTYLGGSSEDQPSGIAVDTSGNAYITGSTASTDFPTTAGAFQTTGGVTPCSASTGACINDAFLTKLNAAGSALAYSTFLGGSNDDGAKGVVVDSAGNAYVAGETTSTNFPTANALQAGLRGGRDAFVTKFNPQGSALVYSTYLGGADSDGARGIAVDSAGNAYVAGWTFSTDFPTANAIQAGGPGATRDDAFVAVLTASGSGLVYSTYLGGSGDNQASGIAVDSLGNAYVTGGTSSTNFPIVNPFQASLSEGTGPGGTNSAAFVAKIGSGSGPTASLSPGSLAFGQETVNTTSPSQTVTLLNASSSASLTIGSITIGGSNPGDFAQSNDCGPSLAAGTSCTITVTFRPAATGTRAATLSVTDNAGNSPETSSLTGLAVSGSATLSPSSVTFSNELVGTTSAPQAVTLTNSGSVAMTISSIALNPTAGTNSGDFTQTNNCGSSLPPGGSCTFNVTFTASQTNREEAWLTVSDSANNSPQTTVMYGTGMSGPATLSPSSLTFGNQAVGTASAPQSITLSNPGSIPMSIFSLPISATYVGDFAESTNCPKWPQTLAAGASCTINVTFTPVAGGTQTGTLQVNDSASNTPQTVSLTGTGTTSTGGGGSSGLAVVQVQNNIDTSSTNYYTSFSVNIATQPGDLLVAFARESSNGTDNFIVTDSAGQTWQQTNQGYRNEAFTSGPRIGMFYVANSAAVTSVTVHYATPGGVIKPGIMVMEISGAASSDFTVNGGTAANTMTSTSGSLSTNNSNDILIFATDAAGNQAGWSAGAGYAIPNNKLTTGASGSNVRMAMQYAITTSTQTGVTTSMTYTNAAYNGNFFASFKGATSTTAAPIASLSPSSLTFAGQQVGSTSVVRTVTLSNTGTAPLSISRLAIDGTNRGDFGQTNNCTPSVAVAASCAINVTFTPTASGTRTAAVDITDSASGSPQTVSLTGTGTSSTGGGSAPAVVQVQNNIDVSGAAFSSFSVNITTQPGDLLVAFVRESSNCQDDFGVTDSAGHSWSPVTWDCESSTGPKVGMFYVVNSAVVTSVTAHYTTAGGVIKPGIVVMEIAGAGGLDSTPTGLAAYVSNNSAASVTASNSRSLSTSGPTDILIFATDAAGNQTGWTAGAGYTIPNNKLAAGASGSNIRMAMQYAVVSSSQANTKTSMTYPNAAWNGNIFAAFK